MARIVHCSDLILRVDEGQHSEALEQNVTEWLLTSTEFRPVQPETCVVRNEVGAAGKISVIFFVWAALVAMTFLYCYFCEQRLFPRQQLLSQRSPLQGSAHSCRSHRHSTTIRRRSTSSFGSVDTLETVLDDHNKANYSQNRNEHYYGDFDMSKKRFDVANANSRTEFMRLDESPGVKRRRHVPQLRRL